MKKDICLGDIILETLDEQHLTIQEFIRILGKNDYYVDKLLKGDILITEGMAKTLELIIGGRQEFWLGLGKEYKNDYN